MIAAHILQKINKKRRKKGKQSMHQRVRDSSHESAVTLVKLLGV